MTPVLTTAIIIKELSFRVIMQQNVLYSECSFYIRTKQNKKAYLANVFQNVTFFFTFTRISNADAKPDLSLLSV